MSGRAAPLARPAPSRLRPQLAHHSTGFDFSRIPTHAANAPVALQAKLTVGSTGDEFEREADGVAERIVRMPGRNAPGPAAGGGLLRAPVATAQTKSAPSGGTSPVSAPSIVGDVLNSPGQPLDASTRAFMEPRFGHDFSKVRVHAGEKAADSANAVNAKAYTVGNDIVMGAGQYSPSTAEGKKLLGHELTHVVQQGGERGLIQRLIRTPYPWTGVITPTVGAHVRSAPDAKNASNIVDSIPKGTSVTVLSASGDWLKVREAYKGKTIEGYVHNTLVDDASAARMEKDMGTTMTWLGSGPGSGTDFEQWASAAKEAPFPAISSGTVMNCWEAVLTSAFKAGSIDWKWIHDLYKSGPTSGWPALMTKGARQKYTPGGKTYPQRGDLVFFDDMSHVAMATGKGSEVYTFWPPPKSPWAGGATVDKVKKETIESLDAWWKGYSGKSFNVTFAPPNW
jgi:uncharacterized protein YgiM (DUF1202 family)